MKLAARGVRGLSKVDYHGARGRLYVEWASVTIVGTGLIAVAAFWPVTVTTGWFDQIKFHWPTVQDLARGLPRPNIVAMKTATGPVYHLLAAMLTRLLGASMELTQFVIGTFCWATVSGATIYLLRLLPRSCRWLVLASVLASPYILQSTLWMTTDALALAVSMAALSLLIRISTRPLMTWQLPIAVGVLIAIACAIRQTAVWLVLVAIVAALLGPSGLHRRSVNVVLLTAPAILVLLALVGAWGGTTPPATRAVNGGSAPLGLPVGFALWAFFATPLLVSVWTAIPRDRVTRYGALGSGVACSAPAAIWISTYSFPDRAGGWPWKLFQALGGVADRSPALIFLAFVGGTAVFMLLRAIAISGSRSVAWTLGMSIYGSIAVSTLSAFALPKYREIPLLACFPLLVVAVYQLIPADSGIRRRLAPYLAPAAALQILAGLVIVMLPFLQYMHDPASVPLPEWVGGVRE